MAASESWPGQCDEPRVLDGSVAVPATLVIEFDNGEVIGTSLVVAWPTSPNSLRFPGHETVRRIGGVVADTIDARGLPEQGA